MCQEDQGLSETCLMVGKSSVTALALLSSNTMTQVVPESAGYCSCEDVQFPPLNIHGWVQEAVRPH